MKINYKTMIILFFVTLSSFALGAENTSKKIQNADKDANYPALFKQVKTWSIELEGRDGEDSFNLTSFQQSISSGDLNNNIQLYLSYKYSGVDFLIGTTFDLGKVITINEFKFVKGSIIDDDKKSYSVKLNVSGVILVEGVAKNFNYEIDVSEVIKSGRSVLANVPTNDDTDLETILPIYLKNTSIDITDK